MAAFTIADSMTSLSGTVYERHCRKQVLQRIFFRIYAPVRLAQFDGSVTVFMTFDDGKLI